MAKHIHIWVEAGRQLGKTKDAGPAHAPAGSSKGGQFVSGSGGGGKAPAKKTTPVPNALAAKMLKQENSTKKEAPSAPTPRGNSSDPKEREAYKEMQRKAQAKAPSQQPGYKQGKEGAKPSTPASNPRDTFAAHRKEAGAKGQEALNLAEAAKTSKDPAVVKKAYEALLASSAAHKQAGESFAKVPYPGESQAGEHHAERHAAHSKLAEGMKKRLDALTSKPSGGGAKPAATKATGLPKEHHQALKEALHAEGERLLDDGREDEFNALVHAGAKAEKGEPLTATEHSAVMGALHEAAKQQETDEDAAKYHAAGNAITKPEAKPTPKHTPMKQAEPEVAFRREMIAKNPRGTTFFYNNETKTTEAYHKGKLVGSLKDHS